MKLAAKNGHVECVKYLHEVDKVVQLSERLMSEVRHVEMMKYLRSLGGPWSEVSCQNAAEHGMLDSLKYAHEDGAPWMSNVISRAAAKGYLECMAYAMENSA